MLTTKTFLLKIFVNIILTRMSFLVIHGISLNVSGTSIFLTRINCLLPNILSLDLLQELHPACSVLIFCLFKVHSITEWAAQLKINPLYAILSGFDFDNTPDVGTFYDFSRRLWDSNNLSRHIRPLKKKKVKQRKQKGSKAQPVEKITVEQLLKSLETDSFSIDDQPYASLFKIYSHEFLTVSISKGFIDPSSLSIAGDGTPVVTSARARKHRVCGCKEKGITDCDCERYFSQPGCDIGWDSFRDYFIMVMICTCWLLQT